VGVPKDPTTADTAGPSGRRAGEELVVGSEHDATTIIAVLKRQNLELAYHVTRIPPPARDVLSGVGEPSAAAQTHDRAGNKMTFSRSAYWTKVPPQSPHFRADVGVSFPTRVS
jgi:hypothetical protein